MKYSESSVLFNLVILFSITFSGEIDLTDSKTLNGIDYKYSAEQCKRQFSCVNCTTVRVCKPNYYGYAKEIEEFQCPNSAPFCDQETGTCVKSTNTFACGGRTTDFDCSSNGFYPNPLNCKKYFVCVKGIAYEGDCDKEYYNPLSQNCNKQDFCYVIKCNQKSGIKVALDSDESYYGYCYNNNLVSFEKCPGQFEFDSDKQNCVPVCKKQGLQGDPFDCKKYYKCSYELSTDRTSYKILPNHKQCNSEEFFDSANLKCSPLLEGLQCSSGLVYTGNGTFVHKDHL